MINPDRFLAIVEVDETLVLTPPSSREKYAYNTDLMTQLQAAGITDVVLFHTAQLNAFNFACSLDEEGMSLPNTVLLKAELAKHGITAHAVVTPVDSLHLGQKAHLEDGLGAYSRDKLNPFERRVAEGEELEASGIDGESLSKHVETFIGTYRASNPEATEKDIQKAAEAEQARAVSDHLSDPKLFHARAYENALIADTGSDLGAASMYMHTVEQLEKRGLNPDKIMYVSGQSREVQSKVVAAHAASGSAAQLCTVDSSALAGKALKKALRAPISRKLHWTERLGTSLTTGVSTARSVSTSLQTPLSRPSTPSLGAGAAAGAGSGLMISPDAHSRTGVSSASFASPSRLSDLSNSDTPPETYSVRTPSPVRA